MTRLHERIPALFVALGLLLGPLYCLMLPPLQAPDEVAHFDRALILSEGYCVARPDIRFPEQVLLLQRRYPGHLERTRRITPAELITLARTPLEESPQGTVGFNMAVVYSCLPYAPAAAVLNIARHIGAPAIDFIYLGRLANLVTYLAVVYLALRFMPAQRLLLFCLALMPMTLQQAASLSADSLTFAAGFLFCAYVLKVAFGSGITWRDQCILSVLTVVLSLLKFAVCLVPLILLVPRARFSNPRRYWIFCGFQIALACWAFALWQMVNHPNAVLMNAYLSSQGIHAADNLRFLYREPVVSAVTFLHTLASYSLLQQFIGSFGWLSVSLPGWDVFAFAALLIVTALTQSDAVQFARWQRVIIAIVVLVTTAGTFIVIWASNVTQTYLTEAISHGTGLAPGVQGRYFIPIALPALLLLSNRRLKLSRRIIIAAAVTVVILSNGLALDRVRHTFYVSSPYQGSYEGQLVRRPGNSPEDIKVYIIRDGVKHWVPDKAWIIRNGFRWPEDVKTIPASELDSMPTGEAILNNP